MLTLFHMAVYAEAFNERMELKVLDKDGNAVEADLDPRTSVDGAYLVLVPKQESKNASS